MLNLKCDVIKTADFHEIQDFMDRADVEVLVGFPSGRQHVETKHGKGKKPKKQPVQMDTDELAKILTFGSDSIPPRPFIEEGLLSQKEELRAEIEKQLDNARDGKANWAKVGTKAVGAVQDFVRSDYYKSNVPNSPVTIAHKGSDTPLIDGGDLVNALTFIVDKE